MGRISSGINVASAMVYGHDQANVDVVIFQLTATPLKCTAGPLSAPSLWCVDSLEVLSVPINYIFIAFLSIRLYVQAYTMVQDYSVIPMQVAWG